MTTATIHSYAQERELLVTTSHHLESDHEVIARALRAKGVTSQSSRNPIGQVTRVNYERGVSEREAVRWLSEVLKSSGFSPMVRLRGQRLENVIVERPVSKSPRGF